MTLRAQGDGTAGRLDPTAPCPCGAEEPYGRCCGPILAGAVRAGTAEQLMRSRYTAHVVGDDDHLWRSWHPRTRPDEAMADPRTTWTGLQVRETTGGTEDDEEGEVVFAARFRRGDAHGELVERSRFRRRGGRWVYVDGDLLA